MSVVLFACSNPLECIFSSDFFEKITTFKLTKYQHGQNEFMTTLHIVLEYEHVADCANDVKGKKDRGYWNVNRLIQTATKRPCLRWIGWARWRGSPGLELNVNIDDL